MKTKQPKIKKIMATYIGESNEILVNGQNYNIIMEDMRGKIYDDPNDLDGRQDERIMLYEASSAACFKTPLYKIYNTAEDLVKDWNISISMGSTRVQAHLRKVNSKSA